MMYELGDIVRTKKVHACGCALWEVVRVGADIKIKCQKCGHIVMFGLDKFKGAVKCKVEEKNG